jgi:hypothetical protein
VLLLLWWAMTGSLLLKTMLRRTELTRTEDRLFPAEMQHLPNGQILGLRMHAFV